jgi:dipeptidase
MAKIMVAPMNSLMTGAIIVLSMASCLRAHSLDSDFNCFAVLAGKDATVDGSVMLAHNEDDGGEQLLNWYIVGRQTHPKGERVMFKRGGSTDQAPVTYKSLWLELPGMEVSDSFLNENGVVIASDGCPSREDRPDYTDGGILYELRRLAAERASTAASAVDLMGALIEKYGYADSGRSYVIADRTEAWVLCVVRGRHWAAARVPDDSIAAIANCFTLVKVDLNDVRNYRGSKDIVTYATSRGWYDPQKDGEFSFRRAYATPGSRSHPDNVKRQWAALRRLTGKEFPRESDALPFLAAPKAGKVSLEDLFGVLADHYEGTEADARKAEPENKSHLGGICHDGTQYGFVAQLRSGMPPEMGALLWIAPYHPCSKVFVPWYAGMTKVPRGFSRFASVKTAQDKHLSEVRDFRMDCPNHRYWRYVDSSEAINSDYPSNIQRYAAYKAQLQRDILDRQAAFEAKAKEIKDKKKLGKVLNQYTEKWVAKEMF